MAESTLSLKMQISARGAQARRELSATRREVSALGRSMGHLRGASRLGLRGVTHLSRGLRMASRAASTFFLPLKAATGLMGIGGAAMTALGTKAVITAGNFEALQARLESLTGSQKRAARLFKQAFGFSIRTPFTPEQVVEAQIGLTGLGLEGSKALKTVANAAAAAGRPMENIIAMLAGIEAEPLRRLGILKTQQLDEIVFEFRDKVGRIRKVAADGVDDAREKLLSIFDIRFGGAGARLARTFQGLVSTLKGNIQQVFGDFGEELLPAAKMFVSELIKLLSSGEVVDSVSRLGEMLAKKVKGVAGQILAVVDTLKDVEINTENLNAAVKAALENGAKAFAKALAAIFSAQANIWKGFGQIIAGAFLEKILAMKFIGIDLFRDTRRAAALQNLRSMSEEQAAKLANELLGTAQGGLPPHLRLQKSMSRNKGLQAKLAAGTAGPLLVQQGVQAMGQGIKDAFGAVKEAGMQTAQAAAGMVSTRSGKPLNQTLRERRAFRAEQFSDNPLVQRVTAAKRAPIQASPLVPHIGPIGSSLQMQTALAPFERFSRGQKLESGATVINIQTLNVRANDLKKLQKQLQQKARNAALSPAGS